MMSRYTVLPLLPILQKRFSSFRLNKLLRKTLSRKWGRRSNRTGAVGQHLLLRSKHLPTVLTISCISIPCFHHLRATRYPLSPSFLVLYHLAKKKGSKSKKAHVLLLLQLSEMRNFSQNNQTLCSCWAGGVSPHNSWEIPGRAWMVWENIKNTNRI